MFIKMNIFGAAFVIIILACNVPTGNGYCYFEEENCYVKINCTNNIDKLYEEINSLSCNWNSINIDLYLQSVDSIDKSWVSWNEYPNGLNTNIRRLYLSDIDNIPTIIYELLDLLEIKIVNSRIYEIDWNTFYNHKYLKTINMSQNDISRLYRSSFEFNYDLRNVRTIDLSYNAIDALPNNCFIDFPQLTYLNISHNFISKFDILTFEGMTSLVTLDVSHNTLLQIGHSFARFLNLQELFLDHNNLTSLLEPNFMMMTKLEKITLNSNQLQVIEDDTFKNLVYLKEIDMTNNQITYINHLIFRNNDKLYKILLSDNKIKNIDHEAFMGKNISSFNINNNCLTGVIERHSFYGISTDSLDLSDSKITSLEPGAFSGLHARVLNLSTNMLNNISLTSFKSIESLQDLDLSNNKLNNIDFDLSDLTDLSVFNARNNIISNILIYTFTHLVSLTKLDLSHNRITDLDPQLFLRLKKLEFLDIGSNVLKNKLHPHTFEGLVAVNNIQIANTRIASFESGTFSHLKFLKILNASHGELTSLGFEAFKNTGSIELLDLSNNLLENFVVNGTSIASVIDLYLNDNKIKNITVEPFSYLINLKKIHLANNNIAKFDSNLFPSLKKLAFLDLSSNIGMEFNNAFETLSQLSELWLANVNKQFKFQNLINKSIKKLVLSSNDIDDINTMFIFNIQRVENLNLKLNKITYINKMSFQSMQNLTYLDLSFNLISIIKPGSFLHTNNIRSLNLHNNALSSLQFGVFEGLDHLEILNLSNNALHKFGKNYLHSIPLVRSIALDNNDIDDIHFEDFTFSNLVTIYIGNNPISCHTLVEYKTNKKNMPGYHFNVLAENLDFHNENVDGVACKSDNVNSSITWPVNKEHVNETLAILALAKAIESLREFKDKSRNFELNDTFVKTTISILKSIDSHIVSLTNDTNAHISLIEDHFKKITKYSDNMKMKEDETKDENDNIEKKIQTIMDERKEQMMKEFLAMLQNSQNGQNKNLFNLRTLEEKSNHDDLKGLLYFIAVMMTILLVVIISIISYKYVKAKSIFGVSRLHCSTQPISAIELQES